MTAAVVAHRSKRPRSSTAAVTATRLGSPVVYALLFAVVFASLVVRYPTSEHPLGLDSFVLFGLSNTLTRTGHATWILNPLSYFGMYPFSYPSASMFLVSELTSLAMIPGEGTLLISSSMMAVLGILGAFILGLQLLRDARFALALGLLYGLAPQFVLDTVWEMPSRSGFMALLPIILWTVLRFDSTDDLRSIVTLVGFLALLATFHRLAVLVILVLSAFLATYILLVSFRILQARAPRLFLSPHMARRRRIALLIGFPGSALLLLLGTGVLNQYSAGRLLTGATLSTEIVNLGISLVRTIGLILPLVALGTVFYALKRGKGVHDFYALGLALVLVPMLYLRTYTGFFAAAMLAPLAAGGILLALQLVHRRWFKTALAAGIVILAMVSTSAIVAVDIAPTPPMTMQEYTAGLYLHAHGGATVAFNSGLLGSRISSVSGYAYLPVGGASTVFIGPEQLAFGFVNASQADIQPIPLSQLDISSDSPFTVLNINAVQDWSDLMSAPVNATISAHLRVEYGIGYFAEEKDMSNSYSAFGRTYHSQSLASLDATSYTFYDDGIMQLWFAGAPSS